ncbi:ferritin-like domain-containing protein [Knoellia flava]|nr:ferritin-like domain-containing protein [Knoellia flava]
MRAEPSFITLLGEQVRHEFTASQQYIAIAVWFDDLDLPRLAERFYAQSVEERNHAMMMVRYMLDPDWSVTITKRTGTDWFQVEEHLAREPQDDPDDARAPEVAGGMLSAG